MSLGQSTLLFSYQAKLTLWSSYVVKPLGWALSTLLKLALEDLLTESALMFPKIHCED